VKEPEHGLHRIGGHIPGWKQFTLLPFNISHVSQPFPLDMSAELS